MDRTEVNASPVQKALQGIKKYKYVLLTALLGVLLLLLPQNEKAADPQPLSALCRRAHRVRGRRPRGCPAQGDAGRQRADGAFVRAHLRC